MKNALLCYEKCSNGWSVFLMKQACIYSLMNEQAVGKLYLVRARNKIYHKMKRGQIPNDLNWVKLLISVESLRKNSWSRYCNKIPTVPATATTSAQPFRLCQINFSRTAGVDVK